MQPTRSFFLVFEEAKDYLFLAHAGKHYLLVYDDDDKETAAGHEHPEGSSESDLNLHHRQPEEVQCDTNKVVSDCCEVPQIILLLLLVIDLCVLSRKVNPHFINIVNLDEGADGEHNEGNNPDPLQFFYHSLAEDVPVEAQTLLQMPETLVLA